MVMRRITMLGSAMAVAVAVHTAINLSSLRRPSTEVPPVDEEVSVLIPARDEAPVIASALEGVLNQRGVPRLEVIVLDDHSTDATAALVASITDARLRLISSTEEPPAGWIGKSWACARLADQARGTALVFLDADVQLAPDAIRASVRAMRAHGVALVSPYPRQHATNWLARLTQPLVTWSWCALLPLQWAEQSQRPSLAAANGQFLVMDAYAYRSAGGHQRVADQVLEDVSLMRAFKEAGLRTCTMDGSQLATCEMYASAEDAVDGYAKSLWSAFGSPMGAVAVDALLLVAFIAPPLAAVTARSRTVRNMGVVGYAAATLSRSMVARRTGTRIWPDSALHPASVGAFIALHAISWQRHRRGANAWKGRRIQ